MAIPGCGKPGPGLPTRLIRAGCRATFIEADLLYSGGLTASSQEGIMGDGEPLESVRFFFSESPSDFRPGRSDPCLGSLEGLAATHARRSMPRPYLRRLRRESRRRTRPASTGFACCCCSVEGLYRCQLWCAHWFCLTANWAWQCPCQHSRLRTAAAKLRWLPW